MKVTNSKIGPGTTPLDTGKAGKTGKTDGPTTARTKAPQDAETRAQIKDSTNVNLSPRAQQMQKAKEIARGDDSVDEARVAKLQKMIDEGSYKVDADKIADRLVDEHMLIPD